MMENMKILPGVRRVPKLNYDVKDVQILLDIGQTKAYSIIRKLRKKLVEDGFEEFPAGKVPVHYFLKQFCLDEKEADYVLQQMSKM